MLHLLSSDEPLTMETEWFTLKDAVLQLRLYTKPRIEIAVPGVASPTGARLAGKYGIGLLTIGAAAAQGIDTFAQHWNVVQEQAAEHGNVVDRADWRVMAIVHLAETEEQARRDVEFGIADFFRYLQHIAAFPQFSVQGENVPEMIDFVNSNGLGVIGTPEMLVELMQKWQTQSGGFGTCMLLHHEFANPEATVRSHELLARLVMPEFQGQADAIRAAKARAAAVRAPLVAKSQAAVDAMTAQYQAERGSGS